MKQRSILLAGLLVWLAGATALSASGLLYRGVRAPQLVLLLMTALLGLVAALNRRFVFELDLRLPIAVHCTRFIGAWFVVLYGQGRLPYDFGVKGGVGDCVVASLTVLLLAAPGVRTRGVLAVWNLLGLADILFVVATAARLAMSQPGSMDELRHLPLGLVPTFLVPVIIVSHGVIAVRLAKNRF